MSVKCIILYHKVIKPNKVFGLTIVLRLVCIDKTTLNNHSTFYSFLTLLRPIDTIDGYQTIILYLLKADKNDVILYKYRILMQVCLHGWINQVSFRTLDVKYALNEIVAESLQYRLLTRGPNTSCWT